jgi:4-amino-4-deoxy-L-arabinose transferase-like glycosyltransferase
MSTEGALADAPAAPDGSGDRPIEPWFLIGVGVAMAVGLAVRLTFVAIRQSHVDLTTGDAYWYHWQAYLVAHGHGFLNPFDYFKNHRKVPGADHPPGFVLILTLADKVGITSAQAQRRLMCVMGTATVGTIGLVGRRIANARVGVVAAVIAAVYPNMWINDGMLMSETPFVFAIALSLWFTYGILRSPTIRNVVGLSACLTLAAMTRPESVLLFPLFLVPLVLARLQVPWRHRLLQVAVAAVIPIVAFAPWVAYNLSRFQKPVYISTGAGQTLAVGNCDLTYGGDFLGFYDVKCLLPPRLTPPKTTDPSVNDPAFRKVAMTFIEHHKSEVPKVVAARIGRMWDVYRVQQGLKLDGWIEGRSGGPPGTGLQPVQWALYSFYGLFVLAVGGVIVLRRRRVVLYPLVVQAALATFVAATTFGVTRYRAGAEVGIVLLAAIALDALAQHRWPLAFRAPDRPVRARDQHQLMETEADPEVLA